MQKQIGFYSSQLISSHTHTLPPKKHLQYQCHTKEWRSAQGLGKRSRTGEVTMNKDQEKVFLTLPWIPSLLFSLHLSLMCENNINIRYAPQSDQQQLPPCFQLCAFFHCLAPCSQDSISGTAKCEKVPQNHKLVLWKFNSTYLDDSSWWCRQCSSHESYSAMHRNSPYNAFNTTLPTGRITESKFHVENKGKIGIA